nr:hypothetical protein [uncultured archaeon]
MKGLLIDVDFNTRERAGGIDPNDPGLECRAWQNLDTGKEIRIIKDDRDVTQYEGIDGITVLNSDAEINNAIDNNVPTRYSVDEDAIFKKSIDQKGLDLDNFPNDTQQMLEQLYENHGVKGISKSTPEHVG